MKKTAFSNLNRIICLCLCVCVCWGLFAGCGKKGLSASDIDVSSITVAPSAEKDGLIPTDASFAVSFAGKQRFSEEEMRALFSFEPPIDFGAEKKGGGWTLTPAAPFAENAIVNLRVSDTNGVALKSWAFQTQTGFAVLRSTPGDDASYVPLNSGIEIKFSYANVAPESFQQSFTLSNTNTGEAVGGSVKKYADTLVFIPAAPLEASSTYTASVGAGLSTPDGALLGTDYTINFQTSGEGGKGERDYFENYSPITETFATGDAPLVAINCSQSYSDQEVAVSVYRFRTAEDYTAVLADLASRRIGFQQGDTAVPTVDTAKLDSMGTFQDKLTVPGGAGEYYYGPKYILLPGDYNPGWYYVRVAAVNPATGKENILHKLIQISGLSVYYMSADSGQSLFWLNDIPGGVPAADADIEISGAFSASGKSAANGTAQLDTPSRENDSIGVMSVEYGENRFIDLFDTRPKEEASASEKYVSYLYTDRPIYMSSDTIRLWGMVRPRAGVSQPPDSLRVALTDGNPLYTVPVTPAPDGTFTAELPFEKLGGSEINYFSMELQCGESDTLASVGVEIGDYVKPVYVPTAKLDKPVYFSGETARLHFSTTFFDNTPVSNFTAQLTVTEGDPPETTLTTGEDGAASQDIFLPEAAGDAGWRPRGIPYYVQNNNGENENFYYGRSIQTLDRDLALRGERNGDKLTVYTNRVDTAKITEEKDLYDTDNIIGAPADAAVTAELHKRYFSKQATGSYYDFIRKQNVSKYQYVKHDDIVDTRTFSTVGGVYEMGGLPVSDPDACYYVILRAPDSKGRIVAEEIWLWYNEYDSYDNLHHYNFYKHGAGEEYTQRYTFADGETVTHDVQDNGLNVEGGSVFYALLQDKVARYDVVDDATQVAIPFEESLVPNYHIFGAYFDGRYVYPISSSLMRFEPGQRALDFSITPDKASYAPGDTAKLDIGVTYRKDGKPAAGAPVLLSLVDEAVFAIAPYSEARPLEDIYRTAYETQVLTYVSYHQYDFSGDNAGEKGGGGGDEGIRSDFKDTAAFVAAQTDAQGHVLMELPLPDNITSWRATVQAVTDDLYAGAKYVPVVVSGRFFLNEVLAAQYIAGDNAFLTLRTYGSAVRSQDVVDYMVTVEGNGGKTENKASGKAGDITPVPMGELSKGTYTVTMQAKRGDVQDTVQKTVEVVGSGVEASLLESFSLKDGISIEPQKFPVTLGFYHEEYAMWARVLGHLLENSSGARTDERVAHRYARERMAALSAGEGAPYTETDDLSDVLTRSGFVSLFPYDSHSLPLAARVHLAAPEYFLGSQCTEVFYYSLGGDWTGDEKVSPDDTAFACLGLAAHKEPVLGRVRAMLADPVQFSDRGRLALLAALAALGDTEGARQQYDQWVTPALKESTTGAGETALYIDKGTEEEKIELTALASMAASLLRSEDANGMMVYLMANRSTLDLPLLEEIVYLRYMEPSGAAPASVEYQQGGIKQKLDLDKTGMRFVKFAAEDFNAGNIKAAGGDVRVQASYTGSLGEASRQEGKSIALARTVTPEGGAIKEGSIVKITLTPTLPLQTTDPNFTVMNDYIPSGMRFLYVEEKTPWKLARREGQRVTFTYFDPEGRYDENGEPITGEQAFPPMQALTYYVRCAAPGSYVADSAYIRAALSPDWGMSEKAMVSIEEE